MLDQDLDVQLARLKAEGCAIVRSEKVSGASRSGRAELATVLDFLREGDELVVTRLDRLGRDTRDVLNLIHECEQRGASVTILDPHVSTRGEMGHMIITVLGMVAQMERRFIRERQRDGIAQAKAAGVYRGGKRRFDRAAVLAMVAGGAKPAEVAATICCSRMHVYRIMQEHQSSDSAKETVGTSLSEQTVPPSMTVETLARDLALIMTQTEKPWRTPTG